jgi:hypothetical protein
MPETTSAVALIALNLINLIPHLTHHIESSGIESPVQAVKLRGIPSRSPSGRT